MSTVLGWLEPLRSSVPDLNTAGWHALRRLAGDLQALVATAPHAADRAARSRWLLALRSELAIRGHRAPEDGSSGQVWQALAQFVAGFHDLDLRDSTGPGHGSLILTSASDGTARRWRVRLDAGELVGIAATERRGGSRIQEISTRASLDTDGRWRLNGEKSWVSRLVESTGFVVFFLDPDGRISAAVINAVDPGLEREVIEPFGLGGWSWGLLRLHGVIVDPSADLVGQAGEGTAVFKRHFATLRPLVTATALGTAAGVHTLVVQALTARLNVGMLRRVRDNALVTIGKSHAEITAALLAAVTASRLAAAGHPHADFAARVSKAAGVDVAKRVVDDLAPLIGAVGFQRAHPIAKARADLTGLLYADGIHDSLYRSGGAHLLRMSVTQVVSPSPHCAAASTLRPESGQAA